LNCLKGYNGKKDFDYNGYAFPFAKLMG